MSFKKYILFFAFTFFSPATFGAPADWKEIKPGFSYKIFETPAQKPVHVFRVDTKKYEIKPLFQNNERFYIKDQVEKSKALLGINASFFDENGKALGVVVIDGETKNPFKNISWWGVLSISGEGGFKKYLLPSFSSSSEKASFFWNPQGRYKNLAHAIQAGPRLVVKGQVQKIKDESSPKTAVGMNKNGDFFIVVSQSVYSIRDLASFMAKKETEGGLECVDALNLDGGPSTQLYSKIDDFELSLSTFSPVPVGLGVFSKNEP